MEKNNYGILVSDQEILKMSYLSVEQAYKGVRLSLIIKSWIFSIMKVSYFAK